MDSSAISVKLAFGTTKRRFSLPVSTTYEDLHAKIASLFPNTPFVITYHDNEDDLVTLSSQEELVELFSLANQYNLNPVRLHIYKPEDAVPESAPAPASAQPAQEQPSATRSAQPEPAQSATPVDSIFNGIAQMISAMSGAADPGFRPPPPPPGLGRGRGRGRRSCHWNRSRFGGRHGHPPPFGPGGPGGPRMRGMRGMPPFGEGGFSFERLISMFLGPMMSNLAGMDVEGGTGVFSRWNEIGEATRNAFTQLMAAVQNMENRESLMGVAMQVLSIVKQFATSALGEEGNVPQEAVDGLVRDVRNAGQGVAENVVQCVETLIRTAMQDEVVVDMMRQMRGMDFDMRMPFEGRFGGGLGGFSVHRRVECDSCGTSPIFGSRFKCTNRPNYDICEVCYRDDGVNKEDMEFKECKFVWEADQEGVVPSPPLQMGDRGSGVAFLQKVLTDLGYMNESMYSWRVGMFGPNTRQGVVQFQREYGLTGEVDEGVYDATTAASLSSVLEAQVPPTAAAGGAGPSAAAGSSSSAPPPAPSQA